MSITHDIVMAAQQANEMNTGALNGTITVTTTAPTVTVTSCPTNMISCPASLGGGCCQSGAQCGTSNTCLASTTTVAASSPTTITTTTSISSSSGYVAPARPTGSSDTTTADATTPLTTTSGTEVIAVCPTNYYFCSAYYRPGCCRIGRDCSLTDCPSATASTSIVSDGVTIVVPEGGLTAGGSGYVTTAVITGVVTEGAATTTLGKGSCQSAWQSCGQDVGGGCCPPYYACGTVCSATGGGYTGIVSKVAPSTGAKVGVDILLWSFVVSAGAIAVLI